MYRFKLKISSIGNGVEYYTKPRYEDSINRVVKTETNQVFHRTKLDGEFIYDQIAGIKT